MKNAIAMAIGNFPSYTKGAYRPARALTHHPSARACSVHVYETYFYNIIYTRDENSSPVRGSATQFFYVQNTPHRYFETGGLTSQQG